VWGLWLHGAVPTPLCPRRCAHATDASDQSRGLWLATYIIVIVGTETTSERLSVVVVDDHRLTAMGIADSLRARQITVSATAHSVAEAVRSVGEHQPDVVCVDLDLGPGPSGLDLATVLRAKYPRMGIVVLTAYEDPRLFIPELERLPHRVVYLVKQRIDSADDLVNAVSLAQQYATGSANQPIPERFFLTRAQAALLRLVAQGLSNQAIAVELSLTEDSVAKSVNRLAKRLSVSRSERTNLRVGLTQRYYDMVGYQREG
jgi:DNA-binding NarL/FixJ family response regulator